MQYRTCFLGLAAVVVTLGMSGTASAQPFSDIPVDRPTVSPYLNLLDESPGSGVPRYFTQVKPQVEARRAALENQTQIQRLARQVNAARPSMPGQAGVRGTGHSTQFMNMSHYYNFPTRR